MNHTLRPKPYLACRLQVHCREGEGQSDELTLQKERVAPMKTDVSFTEMYIKSLGQIVKLRILSPSEIELLESMNESDRESEYLLQGIYNPTELMKQLTLTLGLDLINVILSPSHETFDERLHQIKIELLDAICEINELAHLRFKRHEKLDSALGQCMLLIGVDGVLRISSPETIKSGREGPESDETSE